MSSLLISLMQYEPATIEWLYKTLNMPLIASWILCAVIPTHKLTRTAVLSTIVAISAVYVWCVPSFFFNVVPDGAGGQMLAAAADFDWSTIAGVAAMFQSAGFSQIAGAWIHYLAFDLFVGWTIARDAAAVGISKLFVVPCLLFTFGFGPMGALMYLGLKGIMGRSGVRGQLI